MSANELLRKLHTIVSVAFSYLHQCRVITGGRLLLLKAFQWIQQKGGELRDRPIGNWNKERKRIRKGKLAFDVERA